MTVFMTDRRGPSSHYQGLSLLANCCKALQPSIVVITEVGSVEAVEAVYCVGCRVVLDVLFYYFDRDDRLRPGGRRGQNLKQL